MKRLSSKLTYANVTATLALFLVLAGGSAFAATKLAKNSVGTKQLKANSVTGAKVKAGSLSASDLAAGAVPAPVNAYTKPESDSRYSSKSETAARSYTKPESDSRYSSKSETAAHSYSKAEGDGRYLRGTVTVVGTIPAVAANSFQTAEVSCPAGYQAIGGGVDSYNVLYGKVSSSAPTFDGSRAVFATPGQNGPANGWYGAISTEGAGTGVSNPSKIVVICSPIG